MRNAANAADLLADLVRLVSPDPPGREIEIARFVRNRLGSSGIQVELDEFAPGRANLLARIPGEGRRPALVFSAHFDTLPVGEGEWLRDPFGATVLEGRLYGRGASDMKSGMAAMIAAAERIAATPGSLEGDLVLAFSAGESSNCLGARRFAETRALRGADALLISEPTSLQVALAEMAALQLRLVAHGRSGHVSGGDAAAGRGANAIERMTDALVSLRAFRIEAAGHPLLGPPSVSVGAIRGGAMANLTPDRCAAEIDCRLLPGMDPAATERALARHLGADLTIERIDFKPSVETPVDDPFARLCLRAVGGNARPIGVSYFSDAAVLSPAFGLPMVLLGPGELGLSGQTDEYCDLAKLEKAAELYELIARERLGGSP